MRGDRVRGVHDVGTIRRAVAIGLVAAGLLLPATPAGAHAKLQRADPKPGSRLSSAPAAVRVWFQEELDAKKSALTVSDRSGRQVTQGKGGVDLDDLDRKSMIVKLKTIGAGSYTVRWTAVSADDGNVAKGSFRFTVAARTGHSMNQPGGALPPLKIISPAAGSIIANPIRVVIETPVDVTALAMGGDHMGSGPIRHLHADIGTRMTMPTVKQITKIGANRYGIDLGTVRAGPQTLRVYWADAKHKAFGPGQTVRVTVK